MQKWIILGNRFLSGNVECHFELIPNNGKWTDKDVSGGGLFIAEPITKTLILFGKSTDYGSSSIESVSTAEFHFRWDDWTIYFTTYEGKYFDKVMDMPTNDFDWIREPIKDELTNNK